MSYQENWFQDSKSYINYDDVDIITCNSDNNDVKDDGDNDINNS